MSAATVTMRDFVTLQTPQKRTDPRFGPTQNWTPYAQVWAQVLPQTGTQAGTEQFVNQGVQTVQGFVVTIRYRRDVSAKDRVVYRGQNLEVLSAVDPDGLRSTLELNCRSYPGVQS